MKTYKVLLFRRCYDQVWVNVEAGNNEEAEAKALDQVGNGDLYWEYEYVDDVFVEDMEEVK